MSSTNGLRDRVAEVFAAVDRQDAAAFARFLTDDAVFQFGSAPPVQGRAAIEQAVAGFFASIAGCRHHLHQSWNSPGSYVCEGTVCYQRHDGSEITLPFADVFDLRGEMISGYRIYMDINPLFSQ
ncbi:MAG: nuclear transport factor 2 family protein [Gammaproteobacteria bacterium]|nr:nuclear transport factor 2 family protein [Gammaproteobacteria bacterium]NNF67480.1 nuclear transport factor 2 family protein [Gammaproteobacteria bacterium]